MLKGEVAQSSVESVSIEEQLKESRDEFQTLFNLMPDPVVIVDGKGKFLAVNDRVEEKLEEQRQAKKMTEEKVTEWIKTRARQVEDEC